MHLTLLALALALAPIAAQVIFNTSTSQFTCPSAPANGAYCTGPSLSTNIIVRCAGTTGVVGNCNDNLAGAPPLGVKEFAPCYESSSGAGDAACSYGGTVYPDHGASFPVSVPVPGPGSNSTNTNATIIASNVSLSLTALPIMVPSAFAPAGYTALANLASARYPIPSASNVTAAATATATGTGILIAPSKTGGSGATFTGAAGRMEGAVIADLVAGAAAAVGAVLLF